MITFTGIDFTYDARHSRKMLHFQLGTASLSIPDASYTSPSAIGPTGTMLGTKKIARRARPRRFHVGGSGTEPHSAPPDQMPARLCLSTRFLREESRPS